MDRIKLPGVTEESRAIVQDAVARQAHDEEVMRRNKAGMLRALIGKGIFSKPTTSHRHPRRRA